MLHTTDRVYHESLRRQAQERKASEITTSKNEGYNPRVFNKTPSTNPHQRDLENEESGPG